jgi:hypothetical protein
MKRSHTILLILVLLAAFGCAENRAPKSPGKPATGTPTALDVLRHRQPRVTWEAASEVHGDLDRDGVADFALRGLRKDRVVVGIVKGPLATASPTWILDFAWGKGTQDSLCSQKARIELEDLDESPVAGAKPAAGKPKAVNGKGISLYDDRCDAFHIYWNAESKKFDWWRL